MGLHWDWKDKCGEAVFEEINENGVVKNHTVSLYQGNAYLIMLNEWVEDGKEVWSMNSFWADKQHMKNCLGLNHKDGFDKNIYDQSWWHMVSIKLNKNKCAYYKDIVDALIKAFDSITIQIISEE